MRNRKCLFLILMIVVACLLACGCNSQQHNDNGEKIFTVKFVCDGNVIWEEEVVEDQFPARREAELEGHKFYGWRNKRNELVEPHKVAVVSNVTYYADVFPDLTSHAPYLSADDNRFLRPDAALTNDELAAALDALATPAAKAYLPQVSKGTDGVTAKQLKDLLLDLFPMELVEAATKELKSETVARVEFTVVMNALLERSDDGVVLPEGTLLPYDMATNHDHFADLAEAVLLHTHADSGNTWVNAAADYKNPEGFFNVDGWLYHVNADGQLTVDSKVGTLTFGADGRYTSTDAELDQIVVGILADIINKYPNAERIDWLRRAFEYSRDSFSYLRRNAYAFGATGWEIEDAKKMFTTKRGNCYSYAATFWALARGLGYEAICISGTMTKTYQPHSWVEIPFDGEYFVFDAEMEMVYRTERGIYDRDMFMVSYEKGKYWTYVRP